MPQRCPVALCKLYLRRPAEPGAMELSVLWICLRKLWCKLHGGAELVLPAKALVFCRGTFITEKWDRWRFWTCRSQIPQKSIASIIALVLILSRIILFYGVTFPYTVYRIRCYSRVQMSLAKYACRWARHVQMLCPNSYIACWRWSSHFPGSASFTSDGWSAGSTYRLLFNKHLQVFEPVLLTVFCLLASNVANPKLFPDGFPPP